MYWCFSRLGVWRVRADAQKAYAGNVEEEEQSSVKLEGLFDENEESEKAVESIERKARLRKTFSSRQIHWQCRRACCSCRHSASKSTRFAPPSRFHGRVKVRLDEAERSAYRCGHLRPLHRRLA